MADLAAPGYHINSRNQLVLESEQEMARRGIASPDDADALALTFAQQVYIPPPELPYRTSSRNRTVTIPRWRDPMASPKMHVDDTVEVDWENIWLWIHQLSR